MSAARRNCIRWEVKSVEVRNQQIQKSRSLTGFLIGKRSLLDCCCGCRRCWFGKLAANSSRHVNHCATDFNVAEITTALWPHGVLAFECGVPKGLKAGLDARRPSSNVAELRSPRYTSGVTSSALSCINFRTSFQWTICITNLNGANFLDPLSDRFFHVPCPHCRLVGRGHVVNQRNDGENGNHEREKRHQQKLLRCFDWTGVLFFVSRAVVVCAHGVLKKNGISGGNQGQAWQPMIIAGSSA